ncbi:MAG TPA: hypothetical protein P5531_08120 [Bacteroidales bacterium]|nr:hypothetical protein [Bacteroidales bacterium]HSA43492.1 hypothetical protein [Bacteroidales bacterium]
MTDSCLLSDCCNYRRESVRILSVFTVESETDGKVTLLPADNHAAAYPLAFEMNTGIISHGKLNFFNRILFDGINNIQDPASGEILWKPHQRMHSACIIINLLDHCYGHALLKLFNLQAFWKKYGEHYDLCVITNPSLSVFIPDDKFAVIEIKKSFSELQQLWNLESILSLLGQQYRQVEIAVLNTYFQHHSKLELSSFFNLDKYIKRPGDRHYVTFVYRRDPYRKWGGKLQKRNIIRYFKFISEYFSKEVEYTLIGEKDRIIFPKWINDRRCTEYTAATEYEYAEILGSSIITAGVHGSHLIMASLLSTMLVHLVPPWKIHNTGEDSVNTVESTYINRQSEFNLNPGITGFYAGSRKAALSTLFRFAGLWEKQYKVSVFDTPVGSPVISQDEFIGKQIPVFRYGLFRDFRIRRERNRLRLVKLLRIFRLT